MKMYAFLKIEITSKTERKKERIKKNKTKYKLINNFWHLPNLGHKAKGCGAFSAMKQVPSYGS